MLRRRVRTILVAVLATGLMLSASALTSPGASAAATSPTSAFAWDGSEGGWLGAGLEAVYRDGQDGAVITATGNSSGVSIRMQRPGATSGMGELNLTLGPPRGARLVPGTYERAVRPISAQDSEPRLDASQMWARSAGAGCNTLTGRFVVQEATYDPATDAVQTFAATFQEDCEGLPPTVFGEVRYRSAVPFAARHSQLRSVPLVVAAPGDTVDRTLTITADGPEPLRTATATLSDPSGTFSIVADGCSNITLNPGQSCNLTVRYRALDGSPHQAILTVPDNTARGARRYTLYGAVSAGPAPPAAPDAAAPAVAPTSAVFIDRSRVNEGRLVRTYRDGEGNHTINVTGDAHGAFVALQWHDPTDCCVGSNQVNISLTPADGGDTLAAGRDYIGATRWPFNDGAEPGLQGGGCDDTGAFTIFDIGFDADGAITRLAAAWIAACIGGRADAGEVRWRSTVPLASRTVTPDGNGLGFYISDRDRLTTEIVTVTSQGSGPLSIGAVEIAAAPTGAFTITDDNCSGVSLPPGASCRISLRYTRSEPGSDGGQLIIPDNTAFGGVAYALYGNVYETPGGGNPAGEGGGITARSAGGYWMASADGAVYAFGDAPALGNAAVGTVDLEPTPSGKGYWVLNRNGAVSAFGDAATLGSGDLAKLTKGEQPASLSPTPSGKGYWMFTNRGRAIAFGDAAFLGDMAGTKLNGPVLGSVATPSGGGYYMVASDGGIFAFGDAAFAGSMGGKPLNAPVQSLVPDSDRKGYWLVAADGGIFAFDAAFRGSMGGRPLNKPVVGVVRYGDGYLMVGADGGIFNFSSLPFTGSLGDKPPASPVVAVAALP